MRVPHLMLIALMISVAMLSVVVGEDPEPNVGGHVRDAVDGTGIHAIIYLVTGDVTIQIESDRAGDFKVHLRPGEYVYEAEAEGYGPVRGTFVVPADSPTRLLIEMKPLEERPEVGMIHGIVVTENDRPVPNAGIAIYPMRVESSVKPEPIKAVTDENGQFTMRIPYGAYQAVTMVEGFEPATADFKITEETPEVRVRLVLTTESEETRVGIVRGIVLTENERPVPKAGVAIYPVRVESDVKAEPLKAITDENGQFTMRIPYGAYQAVTMVEGFEPATADFKVTAETPEVRVRLILSGEVEEKDFGIVHGMVSTPDGRALPETHVMFMPLRTEADRMPQPAEAITDENGMFKIRLPFGAWQAMAEHRGFGPGVAEFRIAPEMPETRVHIVLEPMGIEPERPAGGIHIHFDMQDRDSDGNPESVVLLMQLDADEEPEVHYEMVDRNSDGIPESMVFELNVEPRIRAMVMKLIMIYLGDNMPPMPPNEGFDQNEDPVPGTDWKDYIGDLIEGIAPDEDGSIADPSAENMEKVAGEPPETVSDKGSGGRSATYDLLMWLGVVLVLAGVVGIIALVVRRSSDRSDGE